MTEIGPFGTFSGVQLKPTAVAPVLPENRKERLITAGKSWSF
jgi:hypothetical protein